MRAYFDSSALVPLLVSESGSNFCRQQFVESTAVVTVAVSRVEVVSAIAKAQRMRRLDPSAAQAAILSLGRLWPQFDVVTVDEFLLDLAAAAALRHGLRGYDAIQHAAAASVATDDLVAVTGDQDLARSWMAAGVTTSVVPSG